MNVTSRSANLLGALGLHVSDLVRSAVIQQAGSSGLLADAVIVIKDQPGRSSQWLSQTLQLSQPGTVHLANRLETMGWLEKRAGADARSHALHLTPAGRQAAAEILTARHSTLDRLIEQLTPDQRGQLADIASALLGPAAADERALARLCRLCDRATCHDCPAYEHCQAHS